MEAKDRIIVALDVSTVKEARRLVEELWPYVSCFKIGLEFINSMLEQLISPNEEEAGQNLKEIRQLFELLDSRIFWDGKLADIPNTIEKAAGSITRMKIKMFNICCSSGLEAMAKARQASEEFGGDRRPLVLGVTILTSLSYQDLYLIRMVPYLDFVLKEEQEKEERRRIQEIVKDLASVAREAGLDGVIASPKETAFLRQYFGREFLIVTPGTRPKWAAVDDQKRITTPTDAIKAGADFLIIGQPITNPPAEIGSPADAAVNIADEISLAMRR